jgi:hypothetical protein
MHFRTQMSRKPSPRNRKRKLSLKSSNSAVSNSNGDVSIVYTEDGNCLYNRRYPRDRIAITVYLN